MGAGLAKDFKAGWPRFYRDYHHLCSRRELKPGGVMLWTQKEASNHSVKAIVAAATKDHWRQPSMLGWVRACLVEIVRLMVNVRYRGYSKLALPLLGAGLGGLPVADVQMVAATALFPLTQGLDAMHVTAVDPQVISEREGKTTA